MSFQNKKFLKIKQKCVISFKTEDKKGVHIAKIKRSFWIKAITEKKLKIYLFHYKSPSKHLKFK